MSAKRKPSSAARGYGWAHQVLRRSWHVGSRWTWSTALVAGCQLRQGSRGILAMTTLIVAGTSARTRTFG